MLMHKPDYQTITGGLAEGGHFTAELNSFAFSSLIDGLYADKIQSPIRELSTNARDGHAEAGRLDRPFELHLPTHFEPVFWVRDYGCSMRHDFMMSGYLRLFHSTKRETNAQVGMLGLGRVSAFTYTDAYTVTCWKDGVERAYSVYLGQDGIPQIGLLNSVPSSEPEGVKVSFPVKSGDFGKFRIAADAVILGFDPAPRVVNETYAAPELDVLLSGDGWTVYNEATFPMNPGLYVQQGCVLYPVSSEFMRSHFREVGKGLCLVIEVPIGTLSVATSREALGYDETTTVNLKARITTVIGEIGTALSAHFDGLASYWVACTEYEQMAATYNSSKRALRDLCLGLIAYKGLPLKKSFELGMSRDATEGMFFDSDDHRLGRVNHVLTFRRRRDDQTLTIRKMEQVKVWVEMPGCKLGTPACGLS